MTKREMRLHIYELAFVLLFLPGSLTLCGVDWLMARLYWGALPKWAEDTIGWIATAITWAAVGGAFYWLAV